MPALSGEPRPLWRVRAPAVCPGPLSACHPPPSTLLLLLLLPFLRAGSVERGSPAVCPGQAVCLRERCVSVCPFLLLGPICWFVFSDLKLLRDRKAKIEDGFFQTAAWREGTRLLCLEAPQGALSLGQGQVGSACWAAAGPSSGTAVALPDGTRLCL